MPSIRENTRVPQGKAGDDFWSAAALEASSRAGSPNRHGAIKNPPH